jgi:5'-3' exonuclease
MGIKYLNSYFRSKCTDYSINQKHLSVYRNKKFVIDTSIYLYRFLSENALIENMYLMISLFKYYNITPVFVFDGKPPVKKLELLKKRKLEKYDAETRYNELLKQSDINKETRTEMDMLYRKMIRIKDTHIKNIKKLITDYGVQYYDSQGEADEMCAYLINTGKVDYCLSDDTDMFLYNCPKVLRNISLINHCVLEYDTAKILEELDMTFDSFKDILVLSGTDYNLHQLIELKDIIAYFRKYQQTTTTLHFYDYLFQVEKQEINKKELEEIKNIYVIDEKKYNDLNYKNDPKCTTDYNVLCRFLQSNGFIFYNKDDNKLPWKSSIPV